MFRSPQGFEWVYHNWAFIQFIFKSLDFLGNIFANLPPSSSLMGKLELVERKSWVDRGEVPLGTSCCFVGMENFFYRPMKDYLLRFYCVSHFFLVRVCDMVIIKHFV